MRTLTNELLLEIPINKNVESSRSLLTTWADGDFYSPSLGQCLPCNGSCKEEWAYQLHWFECPPGELFHLGTYIKYLINRHYVMNFWV